MATSIATSGSTAGQILIVPVIAFLLVATSWQTSYFVLGGTCLALVILKIPTFHILFWSYLICGYTTAGVIEIHFLPYAAFCGFAPVSSATVYGVLSVFNLIGMVGAGWLTDRMHRPLLLGMIYIIRGLTFIILLNVNADIEVLLVFAVVFGIVDYSTVPVTASLVGGPYRKTGYGTCLWIYYSRSWNRRCSGCLFWRIFVDLLLQYDWVWKSSIIVALAARLMVFFIRERPLVSDQK